jgi:hypothetical protein
MRKIAVFFLILSVVPLAAPSVMGQEANSKQATSAAPPEPVHYYHFDFVVEELDQAGKVLNSRSYSTTVDTEPHYLMSIRTGSRVPVMTGSADSKATQFQYIDFGVKLDVRDVHEVGQKLAFDLTANLAGVASTTNISGVAEPVIRQNTWQSRVLIPVGKRTVVFTSDALDSKGSTRVAVTATPIEE